MSDKNSKNQTDILSIRGARMHNLKNVDVDIPKNKLVVITGLSGSGKSSLAFDTLYAEGQRRYVESLSSYARQFLGRLDKPDCDSITGLSPAIAIEQKVASRNPRSTVGTVTEIYDYLKLIYARLGKTYSPISGNEVKRHSVEDVLNFISRLSKESRILILTKIEIKESLTKTLELLQNQGFARVLVDHRVLSIQEASSLKKVELENLFLIVDRVKADLEDEDNRNRIADSVQTAFFEGRGQCIIEDYDNKERTEFSDRFELDGMTFEPPSTHLFSFNNPYGACPKCEGFGSMIGIDEDLVIPNPQLSLFEDCVAAWRGEQMKQWKEDFILRSQEFNFPIHRPYAELTEEERNLLWEGTSNIGGINAFFQYLEQKSYKIQYRVMLARYRGKTRCGECKGGRLRKEASYIKIAGKSIQELNDLPVDTLSDFFRSIEFHDSSSSKIADRLFIEVNNRLNYLLQVGLPYLNLNRQASTLSGGESQRVHLATSLGSSLVGSIYLLDEPSIGLHPKDTDQLISVLEELRDLGNTVIVVEHDEDIMRKADYIIDIGPEAGINGGNLVYSGTVENIESSLSTSYTAKYLLGKENDLTRTVERTPKGFITVEGARENNLKNIDVSFPIGVFCAVTGVSGSGKSTLVRRILYPAMKRSIEQQGDKPGKHLRLSGNIELLKRVEFVDQNPIGRSSRSNPVTYIKAYDDIRNLFADQNISVQRGYKPKHFSFNVAGGRCERCEGEGTVTIEMQFMADVKVVCEECHGKKFKNEILEVKHHGKSIFDVLEMTIDEAIEFFSKTDQNKISKHLQTLLDVGLGYVKLGQSSSTLSGGEAQRIKLASFLLKGKDAEPTMFIFDEPTTGLHFHDVAKLLKAFDALLEKGHTILVIEHQMDVVRAADWLIDLGPEGGNRGGFLTYSGIPKGIEESTDSVTKNYLKDQKNI